MDSSESSSSGASGSESNDDEFPASSESEEEPGSSDDDGMNNLSQQLSQISNQDEYEVDSDDDRSGEYHWSRQQEETEVIAQDPLMQAEEFGKPVAFPDGITAGELVSYIMDDEWLNICVRATVENPKN